MIVTTVLGPIEAVDLGRVDAHEHLFLRSAALPGEEFQDLEKMTAELAEVAASGIDTVIDLTPIGLGRKPLLIAELSRATGVNVVAATGIHRRAHYPAGHWLYDIEVDELVALLVTDIQSGMDERDWQGPTVKTSAVKAGIIKLGASYHAINGCERRWMEAGARAAVATGVPIAVHTEVGTSAHDILDLLQELGVGPHRVMLAHLDRNLDAPLHAELAARGAFLGYDTIGRTKYHSDEAVLTLISDVAAAGYRDKILLGTDVGRRSMLRAYGGGPGMAVLGRTFAPRLRNQLGGELADQLFVVNPRVYFSSDERAQET